MLALFPPTHPDGVLIGLISSATVAYRREQKLWGSGSVAKHDTLECDTVPVWGGEASVSEYERSRTMPGSAQMIFDVASDLGRVDSWMPRDLHIRPEDPPAVTVHEDRTGEDFAGLVRAQEDQLRMEWGTRDSGRYAGWLQITGIGPDTSEVTVHLSFFDKAHAPPEGVVEDALEESLARLEEQVRLKAEG